MAAKKAGATSRAKRMDGALAEFSGEAQEGMVKGLHVRSFTDSFRRAGFEFNRAGKALRLDSLSDEQIEAIGNEPLLSVRGIYMPAEDTVGAVAEGADIHDLGAD